MEDRVASSIEAIMVRARVDKPRFDEETRCPSHLLKMSAGRNSSQRVTNWVSDAHRRVSTLTVTSMIPEIPWMIYRSRPHRERDHPVQKPVRRSRRCGRDAGKQRIVKLETLHPGRKVFRHVRNPTNSLNNCLLPMVVKLMVTDCLPAFTRDKGSSPSIFLGGRIGAQLAPQKSPVLGFSI